jgi:hypothetical protein
MPRLEKDPVLIQRIETIRTAASMVPLQVVEASDEEDADDERRAEVNAATC